MRGPVSFTGSFINHSLLSEASRRHVGALVSASCINIGSLVKARHRYASPLIGLFSFLTLAGQSVYKRIERPTENVTSLNRRKVNENGNTENAYKVPPFAAKPFAAIGNQTSCLLTVAVLYDGAHVLV